MAWAWLGLAGPPEALGCKGRVRESRQLAGLMPGPTCHYTPPRHVPQGLSGLGFELVSTGGTATAIEKMGLAVKKVEDITGFPEMLDGGWRWPMVGARLGGLGRGPRGRDTHASASAGHVAATPAPLPILGWAPRQGVPHNAVCLQTLPHRGLSHSPRLQDKARAVPPNAALVSPPASARTA